MSKNVQTHYEVLGLPSSASQAQIRNAYLQLSKQVLYDYDNEVFNVQSKTDRQPALSTTRDQKLTRNKKIKQTNEHNKSEKQSSSPRRRSRGKVPEVYGGKDLKKSRF